MDDFSSASIYVTPPQNTSDLLNVDEAADFLGITSHTLDVWRCTKRHLIPYLKVGRLVKYRKSDLEIWLASRTINAN